MTLLPSLALAHQFPDRQWSTTGFPLLKNPHLFFSLVPYCRLWLQIRIAYINTWTSKYKNDNKEALSSYFINTGIYSEWAHINFQFIFLISSLCRLWTYRLGHIPHQGIQGVGRNKVVHVCGVKYIGYYTCFFLVCITQNGYIVSLKKYPRACIKCLGYFNFLRRLILFDCSF